VWHDIRRLQRAARVFEAQIYPRVRQALGSEWSPGVDNDPHIVILHATGIGEGVAGYATSVDEFPRAVEPFSNEAEMIVASASLEVGSRAYYALLARQFANVVLWANDRNESSWVEQGLADLAVRLCGIELDDAVQAYRSDPGVALAAESSGMPPAAQRGSAYLLMVYFHEQYHDEGTRALVAEPLNGVAGIEAVVSRLGRTLSFEEYFADWLAASYLDNEPGSQPIHSYANLRLDRPAPADIVASVPGHLEGSVAQFGADYIVIRGENDIQVGFRGVTETLLLDLQPQEGDWYWWTNRADESECTLTGSFDLTGMQQATLGYWLWYDIEPGYDFATVQVSQDGGAHWEAVQASSSTAGSSPAHGDEWRYTGSSGSLPRWVRETADLTPYAGRGVVMVRFVYRTDGAVTGPGLALDDIKILELDHVAPADAGDGEWQAEGFLRTGGTVGQRYLGVLIGLGESITVERLPISEDQTAVWVVPLGSRAWREAVLVVSGLAPLTGRPAPYALSLEPVDAGG
jgi:hypothetical protein